MELANWIKGLQLKQVLLLASSFVRYFVPALLNQETNPFRYLDSFNCELKSTLQSLNYKRLEDQVNTNRDASQSPENSQQETKKKTIPLPGAGTSKYLFSLL